MAKATTMGPMKIKESGGYRVFKVFNAIILTLISVAMLYPFLYLIDRPVLLLYAGDRCRPSRPDPEGLQHLHI